MWDFPLTLLKGKNMVYIRRRLKFRGQKAHGWNYLCKANENLGTQIGSFGRASWLKIFQARMLSKEICSLDEKKAEAILKKLKTAYIRRYEYEIVDAI